MGVDRGRVLVPVGVVAAFAVLAVALYLPVDPLSSTELPRGPLGDPVQMVWDLQWVAQSVTHLRNPFHTTALDYPLGVNLAVNTLSPLLGVVMTPFTLTLGPVAAFNLLLRLSLVASAASMCFCLRRWCRWWPACVVGGLLFGFGPWAMSQANYETHIVLLCNPMLPLLFLLVDELLVRRRRNPVAVGLLLGLAAAAQFLIDAEMLADATILAALAVGAAAVRALLAGRREQLRAGLAALGRAAAPAAVGFVVLGGFNAYELLLGPRRLNGPVQSAGLIKSLHNDLLSVVVPTTYQLVTTGGLARVGNSYVHGRHSDNGGYLGVVLLAAFLVAVWVGRRTPVVRLAAGLAVVSWVLSLGYRLTVDGTTYVGVPLPEALLARLPLLANLVADRLALFTILFVAAAVAIAASELHEGRGTRVSGRRADPVLLGALGLVVVSLLPVAPIVERPLGWPGGLVAELRRIVPLDGVVLSYPYPVSPWDSAMGWAADDDVRFRLIGGYATVPGPPGSRHALTNPPLTAPDIVQEYLAASAAGPNSPYPQPVGATLAEEVAGIRQVLRADHVAVVVDWPIGRHPDQVTHLFRAALGPPSTRVGDVLIWRIERPTTALTS